MGTTWNVGFDWVTATAKPDTREYHELTRIATRELNRLSKENYSVKKQQRGDYIGLSCGKLFIGHRTDSMMVIVSGQTAHRFVLLLREEGWNGKITRLDTCADRRFDQDEQAHAFKERSAFEARGSRNAKGQKLSSVYFGHPANGDSFTIGSRTSERSSQLYDKSREQLGKIEPNLWRYETRNMGGVARFLYQEIVDGVHPLQVARDATVKHFEECGFDMAWCDGETLLRNVSSFETSDALRSMLWVEHYVMPTLLKLIQTEHAVMVGELIAPLIIALRREGLVISELGVVSHV